MVKKSKWCYTAYVTYLNEFFSDPPSSSLHIDSKYVQKICERLNTKKSEYIYTPNELLSNIFTLYKKNRDLNFIYPNIPEGNINNFFNSQNKSIRIDTLRIKEGLIKAVLHLRKKFNIQSYNISYNDSISVQSNISNLMQEKNLSELEANAIFYQQQDIIIDNNTALRYKEESIDPIEIINNNQQYCSDLRKEIGKIFDHSTKEYNLFLLNDGTGSGKTHNAVINFIHSYPNKNLDNSDKIKRKSLVFLAPQKNQLFINNQVFYSALQSHIPLLFARSQEDLINLESKNYLSLNQKTQLFNTVQNYFEETFMTLKKSEKSYIEICMKKLYEERIKKSHPDRAEINIDKIPHLSHLIDIYINYRDFEKNHLMDKKYNYDYYEEKLKTTQKNFSTNLKNLAKFFATHLDDKILEHIFKSNSIYDNFSNFKILFKENYKFYELVYRILIYVMPFEVAKHINTIIYLTGDKSQTALHISEVSTKNSAIKIDKSYLLQEMVSGCQISKKVNILEHIRHDSNFGKFLEEDYFIKNEKNYFLMNKLGFSVVEDEEHVLYNNFIKNHTFKKITEKKEEIEVNTIHALASITRWVKNSQIDKRNILNYSKIVEEKNSIIKKLFSELKKHSIFKNDKEIIDFFEIISSNEFGIFVKTSDYDFISTVCDNIIAFSPRFIVLQEYLKSIKLVLDKGSDYLLISKDTQHYREEQLKYNLFDFFQIILILLYVCKDCSQDLRQRLNEEQSKNNQNVSLYHFINLAHDNKEFLNNLFSSSLELTENDRVNIQFAYFLIKIGFSFTFNENILKKDFNEDSMKVEPHIFIIKELPEVKLLQILHNPENTVFLLSATRGFKNIFSGNYTEYFFNEINTYLPNKIRIFQREKQQDNPMPGFIEDRFNKRKSIEVIKLRIKNTDLREKSPDTVEATVYRTDAISLKNLDKEDNIQEVHKKYDLIKSTSKNYLEDLVKNVQKTPHFKYLNNPYNRAEIINILNAIIHAFENNEHSIIMSRSNRFYRDFLAKEEFVSSVFKNIKYLRSDEENKYKVFDYAPILNSNKKLRFIFFDSALGRAPDLSEHFIIEPDTIVILVSSFLSAGTGLNFTLENRQLNKNQDFNSVYYASSPYYTQVKDEHGYGHLSNQLMIYKYFAHVGNKTIRDLSEGLSSNKIKSILIIEHIMELVKSIMQCSGRIERVDTPVFTQIYFMENDIQSIFEETMSNFYKMFQLHANQYEKTIIANFSMNNKVLLKTSLYHVNKNSLNVRDRNVLEQNSNQQFKIFQNFFSNPDIFPNMLNEYRRGNPKYLWVAELNFIFRDYTQPNYNLKAILQNFLNKYKDLLQSSGNFFHVRKLLEATHFDFQQHGILKDTPITIDYGRSCYSDYSNDFQLVTDKYFFDYGEHIGLNEIDYHDNFLRLILKKYSQKKVLTALPNLYLSHIIRGNIGESILSDYFLHKKIKFNNIGDIFNKNVEKALYELFDFYIVKNNTLYCIDTKNWSLYNDNGAKKTLLRFPQKTEKIKNIKEFQEYQFVFLYLNMFPTLNDNLTNGLTQHLGHAKDTHYMNFIAKKPIYEPTKLNNKEYMKIKDKLYTINAQWENLI